MHCNIALLSLWLIPSTNNYIPLYPISYQIIRALNSLLAPSTTDNPEANPNPSLIIPVYEVETLQWMSKLVKFCTIEHLYRLVDPQDVIETSIADQVCNIIEDN